MKKLQATCLLSAVPLCFSQGEGDENNTWERPEADPRAKPTESSQGKGRHSHTLCTAPESPPLHVPGGGREGNCQK